MKLNLNQTLIVLGISMLAKAGFAQEQNNNNEPITAQHFVWKAATIDMKEIKLGELALQKSDNTDVKMFAEHMIADHKKACKKLQAIAKKEGLQFPETNSVEFGVDDRWNHNWNTNSTDPADTNIYVAANMARGGHVSTNSDGSMSTNWPVDVNNADNGTNNYLTAANPRGQGAVTNSLTDTTNSSDTQAYATAATMRGQRLATNADTMYNNTNTHPMMNLAILNGADFDRAYAKKMVAGHEEAIRIFEDAAANLPDAALKKYADKTLPTLRTHLRMAEELRMKLGANADSKMTNSVSMN